MKVLKTVGLVARFDKKKAMKLTEDLAAYLTEKGLRVCIEETLTRKVETKAELVPLRQMKADLIITIGGDGTILRASASMPDLQPPILAVNMGVRGFLTEVEPEHAFTAVDECMKGKFRIEKCMKLRVTANGQRFPEALNEVVVSADEPTKLLYTRILKDGEHILNCRADGLIVATHTGSTGYSLSAGGPVLDPNVEAFVLTPICAPTVFRSIVFPANTNLTIEVERPKKILVSIDGQSRQKVESKLPKVTVTRSTHEASFVRFKGNFYNRLRSRLLFKGMG